MLNKLHTSHLNNYFINIFGQISINILEKTRLPNAILSRLTSIMKKYTRKYFWENIPLVIFRKNRG